MALFQKQNFRALAALTIFSVCYPISAQTPGPDYVATKMNLYTATSEAWRTDHGFRSTIRLKNMLTVAALDVSLTLYMADGTPYPLPSVHLEKSAVALVNINAALAAAPSSLADHISQSGSAVLQYRYDWVGAALGTISILDVARSLQFVSQFMFPGAAKSSGVTKVNTIQGMWWKYSTQSNVFLAAVNTTDHDAQADVTVSDQQGRPAGSRRIRLGPHASKVDLIDDLIGTVPNAAPGGIQVSYSGDSDDLLFSGAMEDPAVGYSARIPMSTVTASPPEGSTAVAPNNSCCTVASAGLMVGTPDPMEGFPSAVTFGIFAFARNPNAAAITLHGIANYMDKSGPHSIPLTDQPLKAGEAEI